MKKYFTILYVLSISSISLPVLAAGNEELPTSDPANTYECINGKTRLGDPCPSERESIENNTGIPSVDQTSDVIDNDPPPITPASDLPGVGKENENESPITGTQNPIPVPTPQP